MGYAEYRNRTRVMDKQAADFADLRDRIVGWIKQNPGTIAGSVIGGTALGALGYDRKRPGMGLLWSLIGATGGGMAGRKLQENIDVAKGLDSVLGTEAIETVPLEDRLKDLLTTYGGAGQSAAEGFTGRLSGAVDDGLQAAGDAASELADTASDYYSRGRKKLEETVNAKNS